MIAAMLVSLLASSVAIAPAGGSVSSAAGTGGGWAVAAGPAADPQPAVRVTMSGPDVLNAGDRAKVHVVVRDDSYLVVLYASPDGRVHVIYPIYPHDDNFVKAGTSFDVRATEEDASYSFVADQTSGSGMVYAAVSQDPYRFDKFMDGANWNVAAFPTSATGAGAEQMMTDLVQRMANPAGRFDYDLVNYSVGAPNAPPPPTYATGSPPPDYSDLGGGTTVIYAGAAPYPYYPYAPWGYAGYGWGYSPFYFGVGIGFGGCWNCGYYGGYYGGYGPYYGGYPGVYPVPLAYRPGAYIPPVGYRPRATLYAGAAGAGVYPGHLSGTPWQTHGASATVFANAHLSEGPGGVAYRNHVAQPPSTVFRRVQSAGPVAQPGSGHLYVQGNSSAGAAAQSHAVRATPVHMGPTYAGTGRAQYTGGGQAMNSGAMRAQARRVEPGPQSAPRYAPQGGGFGGGHGYGGGGGGAAHASGGHAGGGGGGGHAGGGGGGHGGGGHR